MVSFKAVFFSIFLRIFTYFFWKKITNVFFYLLKREKNFTLFEIKLPSDIGPIFVLFFESFLTFFRLFLRWFWVFFWTFFGHNFEYFLVFFMSRFCWIFSLLFSKRCHQKIIFYVKKICVLWWWISIYCASNWLCFWAHFLKILRAFFSLIAKFFY